MLIQVKLDFGGQQQLVHRILQCYCVFEFELFYLEMKNFGGCAFVPDFHHPILLP